MVHTAGALKLAKRQILNAKELVDMIGKGEILNCYICYNRPVDHYCNICESAFCNPCKIELMETSQNHQV